MTPGLHRVLGPVEDVVADLRAEGWRVATVAESSTTDDFYAGVAAALELPDWFGRNLDALWDCLTDLPQPTALVLPRWQTYATARPERWGQILQVLRERADQQPPFAVVLL